MVKKKRENENKDSHLESSNDMPAAQVDSSVPQEVKPPVPEKDKKFLKTLIFILVPIVVLVFTAFGYSVYKSKWAKKAEKLPLPPPTPPVITEKQPQDYKRELWTLKRVTEEGEEVIYTFSKYPDDWNLIRWNNYIFYGSGYSDLGSGLTSKIEIFSHNLDIGETDLIFELDPGEKLSADEISDLQVISDTLFFSTGGYLRTGATYWVDLPATKTVNKLIEGPNGSINKIKGFYFVIQGEGDSCWGFRQYSLLDNITKIVTPIAKSHLGCSEGEEYIDIDKRDRMLMSFHTADYGGISEERGDGVYTYVTAIFLPNPTSKQIVISAENMPEDIRALKYSEDSDKLFLLGGTSYVFNFENSSLGEAVRIPEKWLTSSISSWEGNTVCLENYSVREAAEINLDTKKVIEGGSICQITPIPPPLSYEDTQRKKAEETIAALDLPPNYKFVLEEYK